MELFEKIRNAIVDTNANVFKIVFYRAGEWQEEVLRPACPCLNCYSLSKNFTATAIGIAQDMGLLSVEDPIIRFFPDELPDQPDEKLARVKIRHLLTQTMGIAKGYLFETDRYTYGTDDWARLILSRELAHEPGEKFVYSNSTFYLLSCIIHRASGLTMDLFLRKHLFKQMGIDGFAWETCPKGETMGATGLYLSTKDVAKLGVLYLEDGVYDGKRLLSQQWVRVAVKTHAQSHEGEGYGYSFWRNGIGYHGAGAFNQMLLVSPEHDLVFSAHAYGDHCDFIKIVKESL